MKLKRKSTYWTGYKKRNVYPELNDDAHDLVKIDGYEEGVISFFEDADGNEYFAIVNASMGFRASWKINYDPEKCTVVEVSENGKHERGIGDVNECAGPEPCFYIGQLRLYRIYRK